LYIYTVKYKSGIKIPVFFEIFLKKIQNIFKKKKKFVAYSQILKFFQAYLHKKNKNCIFFMFKKNKKMDIITSL